MKKKFFNYFMMMVTVAVMLAGCGEPAETVDRTKADRSHREGRDERGEREEKEGKEDSENIAAGSAAEEPGEMAGVPEDDAIDVAGSEGGNEAQVGWPVQVEVPVDSLEDALEAYRHISADGYMLVDLSISSIPFLVTFELGSDGSCNGYVYHYENGNYISSDGFLNFGAGVRAAVYVDYAANVIGFFDSGSIWSEEGYYEYADGTFFYLGSTFNGGGQFMEFLFNDMETAIAAYNN